MATINYTTIFSIPLATMGMGSGLYYLVNDPSGFPNTGFYVGLAALTATAFSVRRGIKIGVESLLNRESQDIVTTNI